MFDPYKDMPLEEQINRFMKRSLYYRTREMDIIVDWVKKAFIKHKPIRIPYYRYKTVRPEKALGKKLEKHGYVTIDENGYVTVNKSILQLDYYILD